MLLVEEIVVFDVDEELAGGTVDGVGVGLAVTKAGHGEGVLLVFEAVLPFVSDGLAGGLLVHLDGEAAALDHEAVDDAVEDGAVVVAAVDVREEVSGADGSGDIIEFDGDCAGGGVEGDLDGHGLSGSDEVTE